MAIIPPFKQSTLEALCEIIGGTENGLTNTQIHQFILQANLEDVSSNDISLAKRKKLFKVFANEINTHHCSNSIVRFLQIVIDPTRYVGDPSLFETRRTAINKQLAFEGIEIDESGQAIALAEKASCLQDIESRARGLKNKLEQRNAHLAIVAYCRSELVANNYFHAVLEANKGLFQRIRDISGLEKDGNSLVEQVFSSNPIVIINNYISQSEKDEHSGFCNLLKGLCSMFRNPLTHEPKIEWPISEQDALDILGIISYCHRRLDNAHKIRVP